MDWLATCDLKERYCRLLDGKEWADLGRRFGENVLIETTDSGGPRMDGRDAAIATIRRSLDSARTVHQVHSPEIEINGDAARAIWAMHDRLSSPDDRMIDGAGHYHEHYVCQQGGWRIAESRLTRLSEDLQPPRSVESET
ncbi:MAG: nuclear transport factor 2 family protein [Sphingomicrobium sp.]